MHVSKSDFSPENNVHTHEDFHLKNMLETTVIADA